MEMNERHKALQARVEKLFSRGELTGLWQQIADNFYPERGDFVVNTKANQTDYVDHLSTSYPLIVRRDLGDSIGGMLRPRGQQWFETKTNKDDSQLDSAGRIFLEAATKAQYRAMYDRIASFTKATKQGDHDYAAFGQAVLSLELNLAESSLLYRNWHLRDVVWWENAIGQICGVARKWKTCPADAVRYFRGNVHAEVSKKMTDNQGKGAYETSLEFIHIVIRGDEYEYTPQVDGQGFLRPYMSIWIDPKNKFVMEESPKLTSYYIIPRWQTVSGSQYATSPAVVAGLPDARLIQAMTYTLLRAGEKAVDPPMMAVQEAVQSDIPMYPGGVTWVDSDYEGKLSEAMQPIINDYRALPTALGMHQEQMRMIETAFYINRLSMPPVTHEMTAEEARYRVQQYIRQALPLFEPIEHEYNAPICENTFQLLLSVNAFGPKNSIPESLAGQDIEFKFESPLIEARDQELARTFVDSKALIAEAADIYPAAAKMMNAETALRDALRGRGAPATWIKGAEEMVEANKAAEEEQTQLRAAQVIAAGGQAAQAAGAGGRELGALEQEAGGEE
jgi:hypothetical protein